MFGVVLGLVFMGRFYLASMLRMSPDDSPKVAPLSPYKAPFMLILYPIAGT